MRPDLFAYTINQLRYGAAAQELSERLNECVQGARDTGKQAKLTLTLTVKPIGQNSGQYEIREQIKAQVPELDKGMTLMFGTPEGNLQREDPRQVKMDLKSVSDNKPQQLKKVEK
ncbi:conserved hypothetical protein [Nitrosococcus halophilus Nc 4]|uniref:Replication terminator protein n=1 Tax=Nitrosococcus halophilus (strain Nc4) TaxID=472759 RepID=D5BYE9_NITHN|nr:hypothetical protein [Nitrosococcus halophilus]ADE14132.1 conserved hypothetical protein [Nitrosococcus halophilus Nc 4]